MVAHLVWDQGVAGSNPVAPTPQGVRANSNAFFRSQRALPSFGCSSLPCRKTKASYRTADNGSKGAFNSRLFPALRILRPHSSMMQPTLYSSYSLPFAVTTKSWELSTEIPRLSAQTREENAATALRNDRRPTLLMTCPQTWSPTTALLSSACHTILTSRSGTFFSRQKETLMMSLTSHHEGFSLYLVPVRVNRA